MFWAIVAGIFLSFAHYSTTDEYDTSIATRYSTEEDRVEGNESSELSLDRRGRDPNFIGFDPSHDYSGYCDREWTPSCHLGAGCTDGYCWVWCFAGGWCFSKDSALNAAGVKCDNDDECVNYWQCISILACKDY